VSAASCDWLLALFANSAKVFDPADVGHFKAEVLARRLARRFRRVIGYSVAPYDAELHGRVFGPGDGLRLLGNATGPEQLRGAFDPERGLCRALPAPALQRPDLLDAPPAAPRLDCAEAVAAEEQGATVNQAIAALAAGFVERLLLGTCGWMVAYVDLDDGVLRGAPPTRGRSRRPSV
jgi:hypothetical protein